MCFVSGSPIEDRVLICTCDSCLGNKLQDKLQNKLQDKLQSTLLNKLQNTEYVDNDVDVDDVDDGEEKAGAYFFGVRHSDGRTNCELH